MAKKIWRDLTKMAKKILGYGFFFISLQVINIGIMVFKRKIYSKMQEWKARWDGKRALMIQGARRIGKSTIVEEFAKNEYESYILIDFSVAPEEVHQLFHDISDLNYVFMRLQLIFHVNLVVRKSLIIFDEVQMEPLARQAIKHLVKDRRYDYIETGSLISVRKKTTDIVIPSEEEKLDMYPMDYEEFRWAMGDTATVPLLRQFFESRTPLGDAVHRRMMRDFRLYMLVGGMPQAVEEYLESNNMSSVDLTKRSILSLYEEDFMKLDEDGRATALFDAVPSQLSKNASRYKVSEILPNERADRMGDIVNLLGSSMTTNVCYHSNDPNTGLALTCDRERYKLYMADTGLFVTLAFKDKDVTENDIYNKLLNDKLNTNMGYVYENVIAQMLKTSGKSLYYHTMPTEDGKKYYEVDFVLSDGFKVSPVEVKSSGYKTHASLDAFVKKFSGRIQNKYIVYTKDLHRENGIDYIPVYMAMFL